MIDVEKIKAGDEVIDLRKIKPGDGVTVRCIVLEVGEKVLSVETDDGEPQSFDVVQAGLVSHTPKVGAGDRAHIIDAASEYTGEVLGINGSLAWLRYDSGGYTTVEIASLERA